MRISAKMHGRNSIYKTSVFGDINENLNLGSTQKKEKKDDSWPFEIHE